MRPPLTRFPLIQSGYAKPVKKTVSKGGIARSDNQVGSRVLVRSCLAFYNRLFLVPKPNRKWRPILDLSWLNLYLSTGTFKVETPETIRVSPQQGEWVTSLDFIDAHQPQVKEVPKVLFKQQDLPIYCSPFRPGHSSIRVHKGGKGSEANGTVKGYSHPPVPRRLVTWNPVPGDLPTTYPDPLGPVPRTGLDGKHEKIRVDSSAILSVTGSTC